MTVLESGAPPANETGTHQPHYVSATRVHVATLAIAGLLLLWSVRNVPFYLDDWMFIARLRQGTRLGAWLLEPHNEHWTLLPKVEFTALTSVFGTESALPFLALTLALHLALCHLLWRVAMRGGADPWIATAAAAGFAFYCGGVENIAWSFQTGLIGNMVLGMATLLELGKSRPRPVVVAVLSVLNIMTSGIAAVFAGLSILTILVSRRYRLLWCLMPMFLVGGLWYCFMAPRVTASPHSTQDIALLPVYWVLGIGHSVTSVIPWRTPEVTVFPGGSLASAALALGAGTFMILMAARWRRHRQYVDWRVIVVGLGCPAFVLLTSVSRIQYGLGFAMQSRYTYVTTGFLVPLLVCLLTAVVRDRPNLRRPARALAVAIALANLVMWWPVVGQWTAWTRTMSGVVVAGQQLLLEGQPVDESQTRQAEFAYMTVAELRSVGTIRATGTPTRAERLSASLALQTIIRRVDEEPLGCGDPQEGAQTLLLPLTREGVRIRVTEPATIESRLIDATGSTSLVRTAKVDAGTYLISSLVPGHTLAMKTVGGAPVPRPCGE